MSPKASHNRRWTARMGTLSSAASDGQSALLPDSERLYYCGKYVVAIRRRGRTLDYDISTRSGLAVACGFEMLAMNERSLLDSVVRRLSEAVLRLPFFPSGPDSR